MTLVFYALQIFLLSLLSYEDWRTKRISLLKILTFTILTLSGLTYLKQAMDYEMIAFILGLLVLVKIVGFLAFKKSLLGNGDLVLLMPLLASLHLTELPLFFISAGIASLITAKIRGEPSVPFVPALTLAYIITLASRFF